MLEISGKTNLLEQNAYKYSLQDVAEPNLQRDIYTQGMVPKVPFNHRRVPMNMPEEIWITDTSLRDGQQSVEPYTVDQIVNIYKFLSRLGGPYGIIRQTEFFVYSKKDRQAIEKCMELDLPFPEITSWIRASKDDFRLVRDLGIKETGILVSCSDYHIFKKMKMTRAQALDHYLGTVKDAPMPSLGSLASEALNGLSSYPYRLVIPAIVISLIVLSLNLFGDGLRDAFDPKLNS